MGPCETHICYQRAFPHSLGKNCSATPPVAHTMCTSEYIMEILSKAGWESAPDMDEYFMTVRRRHFAIALSRLPPQKSRQKLRSNEQRNTEH